LGIIHGHFDVRNEDVIADDIAEGLGAINTGVVVPVEKIMETICQPELSKM
jgi:predicted transcriptional regulator